MAIWDEDGLKSGRVIALEQAVLGVIPFSEVEPLDDEDLAFIESMKKQIAELEAKGIKNWYFSIPQM